MKSFHLSLLTPLFLLLAPMSQAVETFNKPDVVSFLDTLATSETWDGTLQALNQKFPEWLDRSTPVKKLNELSPLILDQDDLDLIYLFQRALRNHDRLSPEKAEPFTLYYKNYLPPAFFIPDIHLTLDVRADKVVVTSQLSIQRNGSHESLILDGRNHKVLSVSVNGIPCAKELYKVTQDELILLNAPKEERFTVKILSEIDPFHNVSLEGLYASGKFLTTQCESEGARCIFYTLDRPDVLSRITTTILADETLYPSRLSNGNLQFEDSLPDGRTRIVWEDPIPKPSYLYACVLGDFGKLEDQFTTKSGRNVTLEVYMEPGKEERAAYSLSALKLAMQFDEEFFDREYDLDCLKMVAVPDFNFGAMENKGLMIFNDAALLADQHSGTDANFRRIASIVAHEYFHNWSGNRVTVRNWFELSLKEGFTDFRAMLFGEWLFGPSFIRPKDVMILKEDQFPEETSGSGHPIIVDSYVTASSIYDATTYIKGREVFRTLQTYMDMMVPGGFREAQNLYFSRYDGQAVTFRELLTAANEVLYKHTGKNLSQFERWFHLQGTPQIKAKIQYFPSQLQLTLIQTCPHPETGAPQDPFLIPFSYEFLKKDGTVAHPKKDIVLTKKVHKILLPADQELIPLFMHGYSAPVLLDYEYSLSDLAIIMNHATDPFIQWEAGQKYSLLAIRNSDPDLLKPYVEALQSQKLSPLAKAQLLQFPTLRALSQKFDDYDFIQLQKSKSSFIQQLATLCKPQLEQLLNDYPEPAHYAPTSDQMQIRELRNACLNLLAKIEPAYAKALYGQTQLADNFDSSFAAMKILSNLDAPEKTKALADFYNQWKEDKIMFNHWLKVQASSSTCTVQTLKDLMATEGYDWKNPNHVRSVLLTFLLNLGQYHDSLGEGYAFIVDQILELGPINPYLAHNNLTSLALLDFEKLPKSQQALMIREMKRLQSPSAPPETRELVKKLLSQITNF